MQTSSTRAHLFPLLGALVACQSTSPAVPDEAVPIEAEPVAEELAAPPEWHWAGVELMGLRDLDRDEVMAAIDIEVGALYETDREACPRRTDRSRAARNNSTRVSLNSRSTGPPSSSR